jgi:hypothetical protein
MKRILLALALAALSAGRAGSEEAAPQPPEARDSFNRHIFLTATFKVTVMDREDDGQYNYCLDAKTPKEYTVSYISMEPLPFKEGESFAARTELFCSEGPTIDEAMSDKLNQWISYNKFICNTVSLEVLK